MSKYIKNPWSSTPDNIADAVAEDRILLIGEDESLRDVASKQFLLGNGTVMAMVYSYAVHYEKDGKLEDIDNRLELTEQGFYRNRAGDVTYTLPKTLTEKEGISFSCGGYTLSFRLNGISASEAIVDEEKEPEGINARMTAVHTESGIS